MEELTACEGTVHSVIFQNAENGYTVLRLLTEEGEVVTVVGCIPCVDTVRCSPGATQGMQPTTVTTSPSSVSRRRTV